MTFRNPDPESQIPFSARLYCPAVPERALRTIQKTGFGILIRDSGRSCLQKRAVLLISLLRLVGADSPLERVCIHSLLLQWHDGYIVRGVIGIVITVCLIFWYYHDEFIVVITIIIDHRQS